MLLTTLLSVAVIVFVVGNAFRIVKFLRMSTPLRWELYPIPKGPRERQLYGGSYFENSDWWTESQSTSHQGELTFMVGEVLFLTSVRDGFRGLWLWSWLLHWGLYLYAAATLFAIAGIFLPAGSAIAHSIAALGYGLAFLLGLLGSLGLLFMRALHPRLRGFTTRTSVFNLLLLGSIFATGMLSVTAGSRLAAMTGYLQHGTVRQSSFLSVHIALVGLFLAYFPFTHMTHAYMKFFTWHGVRWDDSPAMHDPRTARTLAANLQRKVTWAAPHIANGDTAAWSEVVADPSGRGSAKRA